MKPVANPPLNNKIEQIERDFASEEIKKVILAKN
jgi:hypothetical protein